MNTLKNANKRFSFSLVKISVIFSTTLILSMGIVYNSPAFQIIERKTGSAVKRQDSGNKTITNIYRFKKKSTAKKGKINPGALIPAPQPQLKAKEYIPLPEYEIRVSEPTPIKPYRIVPGKTKIIGPSPIPIPIRLTGEQINDYVEDLKYGETIDDKIYAAKALGSRGIKRYINDPIIDEVYDALVDAYRMNHDPILQEGVASSLGKLGKEEAGETLIDYIRYNDDSRVKKAAIRSLGFLKYQGSVDTLTDLLRYDNASEVRAQAANALGVIRDSSAEDALISALDDYDRSVKKEAIKALGKIGSSEAEYPLRDILEYDDDLELREAAANALRRIEDRIDYE